MSYMLTVLYIALIFIRPQEYVEAIKGMPILDFVIAGALLATVLEGKISMDKFKRSPINIFMILMFGAVCLSWVIRMEGWGLKKYSIEFGRLVITYFLVMFNIDTRTKMRNFTWMLVFMAIYLAAQSIYQFHTGDSLTGAAAMKRNLDGKSIKQAVGVGIFNDPNDLAIHIQPMIAFLLPSFHRNFLSRTWVTGFLFMIPLVTGVVYTRSRSGVLGMCASVWFYLKDRLGLLSSGIGLVVLAVIVVAIPRMGDISTKEESARARLDHWSHGIQMLKENPISGTGMGTFTEYHYRTAHNSLILVMAETGLVGTFMWLALFYCGFRHLYAMTHIDDRGPPWVLPYANAMIAAMASWHVSAFFLSQSWKPLIYIFLAMVTASMNILYYEGVPINQPWRGKDTRNMIIITFGAVVFMWAALKVLWIL